MILCRHRANWQRLACPLTASILIGVLGAGCGQKAGDDPLADPQIEKAVVDVQTGKQDPRALRNMIKSKVSGKEQTKSLPKQGGGHSRSR